MINELVLAFIIPIEKIGKIGPRLWTEISEHLNYYMKI
jgi:hypothetical protein